MFRLTDVFEITNRGLVLAGDIINGEIVPGDLIEIVLKDRSLKLKINSVESVDYLKNRSSEIGLMVGFADRSLSVDLNEVIGQTLLISNG